MSIEIPIPLIQAQNREIAGIETAPDEYPTDLAPAFMPMILTFPGEGETQGRQRLRIMKREYALDCYVDPVAGSVRDEPIQVTIRLLDAAIDYWTNLMNDADEGWVLDYGEKSGYRVELDKGEPLRDNGWRMDMEWKKDTYYFGFRLWLPIMVRWGTGL